MLADKDLIPLLFAAFAGFSAFGAAIGGFLAAGGGIQQAIFDWKQHGLAEVEQKKDAGRYDGRPRRLRRAEWYARHRSAAFIAITVIVFAVILTGGAGLFTTFWWMHTGARWAARISVYLFEAETISVTVVTLLAVAVAAAGAASGRTSS